ncbi:WD40 repeat-like protein [Thozetella sp. PMI_491]|nr:WD40 repeat-like protein [Thozetella sp. PMI_491]
MSFFARNNAGFGASAPSSEDFAFPPDATDTIQALRWSPVADCLAAACWDGKVRIYNVANSATIQAAALLAAEGPVFSCDFSKDGAIVAAGGADKKVHLLEASSGSKVSFDAHAAPISAVRFVSIPGSPSSILATASWDKTLRYWDLRQTAKPLCTVDFGERIYSVDTAGDLLAVSTADFTKVHLVNLRAGPSVVAKVVLSKLNHQSRFLSVSGDGTHWAVGGIEGRCSAGTTDEKESKNFDFSWKCHREMQQPKQRQDPIKVWTVNDGSYHPTKNYIFATGGADGEINIWDLASHNRVKRMPNLGIVTAIEFSRDGSYLAYATGYDWSQGYSENSKDKYPPKLLLHRVTAKDIEKPKP